MIIQPMFSPALYGGAVWGSGAPFTWTWDIGAGVNPTMAFSINLITLGGGLTLTNGDVILTAGDVTLTDGDITVTAGDLDITDGDINITDGDIVLANGMTIGVYPGLTLTFDDTDDELQLNGAMVVAAGSAAAPSLAIGEAGTGLYKYDTGQIGFATGGLHGAHLEAGRLHLYKAAAGAQINLYRAEGTIASPTAIGDNAVIGHFGGVGYDGTNFLTQAGRIRVEADENWDSTHHGGRLVFQTQRAGAAAGPPTTHMIIDSAGTTSIGDGGTTNYVAISATGHLILNGTATVWNDINVGASTLAKPVASQPAETQFVDEVGANTGIYGPGFADGDKVSGSIEIPHDYKEGSDITFHIHWQGAAAPTGTDYVKWQVTYTVGQAGETLDAVTILPSADVAVVQYDFSLTSFTAITGTNFNIGDQFIFTLDRITADGDAYAGVAIAATVGLHYECDTIGSDGILTK